MNKLVGQGRYFESTNPKFEEIKTLLDNPGNKEKMEAMKRLLAMMSKGTDVSALYPDVVKNVICKNMGIKKLVYMFLVHYAELEQDPALLAINNFQRDMQSDNQLLRALGMRVMSSIRLRVIVQVVVLAIRKASKDSSPYVRKAAAHALAKVYTLDEEQLPDLLDILQSLLRDHSPMVLGSALWAFNEICPERYDLLHSHFRKICHLLADIDEWGQVAVLNALTRYGRTQFKNPEAAPKDKPEKKKKSKKWNDSDSSDRSDVSSSESEDDLMDAVSDMDTDHRLLLNSTLPLFRSRNSAVVVAAASLYFYLAPTAEATVAGRALTRILHSPREIQYIALSTISTMATVRPSMFAPFLLDFFVNSTDPAFIRKLKLGILTCIATEGNIGTILDELNTYVHREDKELVTASIQAIGRCASRLPEVADSCMRTLMSLISNRSEAVVAESVVVIKKLLQAGANQDFPLRKVVKQLAKLLQDVTVPKARASIVWVIGEYHQHVPLLAPDVLRILAKSFTEEAELVKLQTLNLGVKLFLTNPAQTKEIFKHVLELAKYDLNYDIRDKARLMRGILFGSTSPTLAQHAQRLFITTKPAPSASNEDTKGAEYALGSLSHIVGHKAFGYLSIPDFPDVAPTTDRTPEDAIHAMENAPPPPTLDYDSRSSSDTDGSWSSYSDSESDSGSYTETDSDDSRSPRRSRRSRSRSRSSSRSRSGSDSDSYTDSYSDASSYSDESEDERDRRRGGRKDQQPPKSSGKAQPAASGYDSLLGGLETLNLGGPQPLVATAVPSPILPSGPSASNGFAAGSLASNFSASSVQLPKQVLLSHVAGGGLQIECRFLRRPSIHGKEFSTMEVYLSNHLPTTEIHNIKISESSLEAAGVKVIPFAEISVLPVGGSFQSHMNIAFASAAQTVKLEVKTDQGTYPISIKPPLGELLRPINIAEADFDSRQKELGGMQEASETVKLPGDVAADGTKLVNKVLELLNVGPCAVDMKAGSYKFAGVAIFDEKALLVSLRVDEGHATCLIRVNCENTIFANNAKNLLKTALSQ